MDDSQHRRFVGVDYGTRRIGLAVSDPSGSIASPFVTIPAVGSMDDQARALSEAVRDFDVDGWVVGLPLNMDGSAGPQSRLVETFAATLTRQVGSPVHLWDERQSSLEADQRMARTGLTHKKKKQRRDSLSAQVILQSFLDFHS